MAEEQKKLTVLLNISAQPYHGQQLNIDINIRQVVLWGLTSIISFDFGINSVVTATASFNNKLAVNMHCVVDLSIVING